MTQFITVFGCQFSFFIALLIGSVAQGEEWPAFRGPTGLGYSKQKDLPIKWSGADAESVLWKSPLVGEGHASPIVWGIRFSSARLDGTSR